MFKLQKEKAFRLIVHSIESYNTFVYIMQLSYNSVLLLYVYIMQLSYNSVLLLYVYIMQLSYIIVYCCYMCIYMHNIGHESFYQSLLK